MNVSCPHCKSSVRIDSSHLPAGATARVGCPACKQSFQVRQNAAPPPTASSGAGGAGGQAPTAIAAPSPELEAWLRRELDSLRTELALQRAPGGPGRLAAAQPRAQRRAALVCEDDRTFAAMMGDTLKQLGYEVDFAADVTDALKALNKYEYRLVTVDQALVGDSQGGVKILDWINKQPGPKRRRMFVAYVSSDLKTMDTGSAFVRGANLTVNKADAKKMHQILEKGLEERDELYRVFDEVVASVAEGA